MNFSSFNNNLHVIGKFQFYVPFYPVKKLSEIILVCKDSDFEFESKQQFKDGLWAQANG